MKAISRLGVGCMLGSILLVLISTWGWAYPWMEFQGPVVLFIVGLLLFAAFGGEGRG